MIKHGFGCLQTDKPIKTHSHSLVALYQPLFLLIQLIQYQQMHVIAVPLCNERLTCLPKFLHRIRISNFSQPDSCNGAQCLCLFLGLCSLIQTLCHSRIHTENALEHDANTVQCITKFTKCIRIFFGNHHQSFIEDAHLLRAKR